MRSTINRKFVAVAYGLGLIWSVALAGGAVVLAPPLQELYGVLGIDSVAVHLVATMALVLVLATTVTIALGLALRVVARHAPRDHVEARPKVASHHA